MHESSGKPSLAGWYESMCRPDRTPGADRDRHPLVAAGLSLVLPGVGQLYNRQLFKALVIGLVIYLIGGVLMLAWLLLRLFLPETGRGFWFGTGQFFLQLGSAVPIIAGGLWLFSVIDAARIAMGLRSGRIMVRYGFRKQAAMAAASLVPGVGALIPPETCRPDELVQFDPKHFAETLARRFVIGKILSVVKIAVAVLGLTPLVIGAAIGSPAWLIGGAVVVVVGLVVFLM